MGQGGSNANLQWGVDFCSFMVKIDDLSSEVIKTRVYTHTHTYTHTRLKSWAPAPEPSILRGARHIVTTGLGQGQLTKYR